METENQTAVKFKCKICGDNKTKDHCCECGIPVCDICQVYNDDSTILCEKCDTVQCYLCKGDVLNMDVKICEDCGHNICPECIGWLNEADQAICIKCEEKAYRLW